MTEEERALTARAEVRKQDITDCAVELFLERGYAQTRMMDIANAAGVTKGLLYWYFANKESLVAEALRTTHEELRVVQRKAVKHLDEPLEQIYAGTVAAVCFVLEHFRLFQVDIPLTAELQDVSGTSAAVHASDTASTLRAGQRRGTIRSDDDARALALGNAGVVNQFCAAHAAGAMECTAQDVAHLAARFLVRALAADHDAAEAAIGACGPLARQPR